jgi:hypothetical protein
MAKFGALTIDLSKYGSSEIWASPPPLGENTLKTLKSRRQTIMKRTRTEGWEQPRPSRITKQQPLLWRQWLCGQKAAETLEVSGEDRGPASPGQPPGRISTLPPLSSRDDSATRPPFEPPCGTFCEASSVEARPAGTPGRGAQITAVVEFCAFQSRPSLPEVGTATTEPTAPGGCRNGRWLSGAVRAQAPRPDVLTTPEVQPMVVGAGKRNIGQMRFRADSSSFR